VSQKKIPELFKHIPGHNTFRTASAYVKKPAQPVEFSQGWYLKIIGQHYKSDSGAQCFVKTTLLHFS
jgi:hypothetical protein